MLCALKEISKMWVKGNTRDVWKRQRPSVIPNSWMALYKSEVLKGI